MIVIAVQAGTDMPISHQADAIAGGTGKRPVIRMIVTFHFSEVILRNGLHFDALFCANLAARATLCDFFRPSHHINFHIQAGLNCCIDALQGFLYYAAAGNQCVKVRI